MPYSKSHKLTSRHRILKSASNLFCRFGFQKVSISEIMSLADMTHGAFYTHFESKEALFQVALDELFLGAHVKRLVKGPFSLDHLSQLVGNYLNLRNLAENSTPGPEMILFNDIDADTKKVRKLYERSYLNLLNLVETRIRALTKMKLLCNSDDISERARTILAIMVGAVSIAKSIEDSEEQENILMSSQNQILHLLGLDTPVTY